MTAHRPDPLPTPKAALAGVGKLLPISAVMEETSLGRATIYRRIASGTFPKPISIGSRRVAWAEREIEAWKMDMMNAPAPT